MLISLSPRTSNCMLYLPVLRQLHFTLMTDAFFSVSL